jgi:hypothetical protein
VSTREVLQEHGLIGWPKTTGSRGIHILVRIERRYTFDQLRRAALTIAREVALRLPDDATAQWWKEHRHGVFLDYNQNARDRTVCSAYSVRPKPAALVSAPLSWDEVPTCELSAFTMATVLERVRVDGDLHEGIDEAAGRLDSLLELADRHEAAGVGAEEMPHMPLITISKAQRREDALAGLERWRERHPEAAERLEADDILVDPMRGRSSLWYRVRINLRHVPEDERPEEETPDPDYDPWRGFSR